MSSVKRNIIANYLGSAWNALMGLAFAPLYIDYLGIEAYALIGVFAMLQTWLALLDMGLTPTLSREMARFQAGIHTPQSVNDLVRSVEWIFILISICMVLGIKLAAPGLAADWLQAEKLSTTTVAEALGIAGSVIALRWLAGLYRSAITGLQYQVWLNGFTAIFSMLRGLGVIAVLAWVSSTIQAFFVYQALLAMLEGLLLAFKMRRLLPLPPEPPRIRWQALCDVWRFAGGVTVIAVLATLLTQLDKLLLSRLLPLAEFGYYTLAGTVAGALYMMIAPINTAAYPKLTELVACGEIFALAESYHLFSQLLAFLVVPAALVLSLFSDHILLLWTRNVDTVAEVAPLVSLLVVGSMLNGLMYVPFSLQLAYGWTRFAAIVNTMSVFILVPAVYIGVAEYGAIAAAVIWVVLNLSYVAFAIPFMHRRLLRGEMRRWYLQDVIAPCVGALAGAGAVWLVASDPTSNTPIASVSVILVALGASYGLAAIMSSFVRKSLLEKLWHR